ncbi:MAG: right-handed parallel beta-helix repeat-containing protein [Candidatus Eisenbacteria bacterium]
MNRSLVVLSALLLAASSPLARTWHILPDGSGDAPTIQAGIDSATAGDTVSLANGTYMGTGNRDVDFLGKAITVRSASGDPAACIIDCHAAIDDMHRAFLFTNLETETSILEGITIRNGWGSYMPPDGEASGGAIYFRRASPTIRSCVFENNSATNGGALFLWDFSIPRISACSFVGNHANRHGGAVHLHVHCFGTVEGCAFDGNTAGQNGGAVFANETSFPTIDRCVFTGNQAGDVGGGLCCWLFSDPVVRECSFRENRASHGGGISAFSSSPTITECVLIDNHADDLGGGIMCKSAASPAIERCLLAGNEGGQGGAVACWELNCSPTIVASTLHANRAPNGSGVYCKQSWPEIERTVLAAGLGGGAVGCWAPSDRPLFLCCDIHGHAGGDWVGCIADQNGIDGNFSEDPRFCDPAGGDFTLAASSPCLPGNHPDGADCGLIGAFGHGCLGPISVERTSWGGVKALFR